MNAEAARQELIARGCEAFGVEHSVGRSLHDIIKVAVLAPSTPARRIFALLIVHSLGVDGLVSTKRSRGQFDRDLCAFLESALPNALRRYGYPFAGDTDQRRQSLERLHLTIDELMQPLEPTFPNWQGLYAG